MPGPNDSTAADVSYTRILVSGLLITTVYVGLTVWESKQRSRATEKEPQTLMEDSKEKMETAMDESWKAMEKEAELLMKNSREQSRRRVNEMQNQAVQKDRRETRMDDVADDRLNTAKSLGEDEWHTVESWNGDERPSPIKAPKRNKKPRSRPPERPEDFPSFLSSLDAPSFAPSHPTFDDFNSTQKDAEKGKSLLIDEWGSLPDLSKLDTMRDRLKQANCATKLKLSAQRAQLPQLVRENDSFLPQVMQGATQGRVICNPEASKFFRTTEDGVLHVDNNVNNTFLGINVFDSRHRGNLENNVRKTPDANVVDGIRPPKTVAAKSEKKKSQAIKDRIEQLRSTLRSEPPPPWKELVLPKKSTSNHASTASSDVLVMTSCQPAWEAQQYIDNDCIDDPDLIKALKKQAITAFLQYRKRFSIFDPYEDEDESFQSGDDIADVPVKTSVKSADIKTRTIPVTTTAVEVSDTGLVRPRQCILFAKLPPEIRIQVYRLLLTTTAVLNAGADIENTAYTLTTDDNDPKNVSGVDSAVMRTCRKMYHETLPVLYGENRFKFRTKDDLEAFREGNLDTKQSETNVK